MTKTCFMVAGEASGDLLGARLIESLQDHCFITGVGGPLMRRAGLQQSLFKGEELAVMGFFQLLPHLKRLLARIDETAHAIVTQRPDMVLTIDAPSFNMRLAKAIRRHGRGGDIRLVHYVAPTVWAWKKGRAATMARLYDHLLTLLPFENDYFTPHGLDCHYVGHPAAWNDGKPDRRASTTDNDDLTLLLCPGSRRQEIRTNGKTMLQAVSLVAQNLPKGQKLHAVMMVASRMEKHCHNLLHNNDIKRIDTFTVSSHENRANLFAADMALAVSGTVSVELGAHGVPHVIVYGGDRITEAIVRLMVRVRYASLLNIMADDDIIPEFLFSRCRPDSIATAVSSLLHSDAKRRAQKNAMAHQIRRMIVNPHEHPSVTAAKTIVSLL